MLSEEGHQLQDPGGEKQQLTGGNGGDDGLVEGDKAIAMEFCGETSNESDPLHPTRRQRKANKAKALKEAKEVRFLRM